MRSNEILRDLARRMGSQWDILCLHAPAQPLVGEMQDVIRYQKRQLDRCADALEYALNRIAREEKVQQVFGCGTEAFERLTAAAAEISGDDVDSLRDQILPGSSAIHKKRTYEPEP